MFLIVGLGNPGKEYAETRHNVAWMLLERFIEHNNLPALVASGKFSALLSEGVYGGENIAVLLPTTFMNNSGTSVVKYLMHVQSTEIVVVHDDVDIPLGMVRISFDRGAGGHNGVKSIIDAIGSSSFIRIRIGVAPKGIFGNVKRPKGSKISNFVLGEFKKGEIKILETVVSEKVNEAIRLIIENGVEAAMNTCNGGV